MRGTGWSRALATSPQALRAAVRALKGAGGRGELGKVPILAVQPFFVTRRHAAAAAPETLKLTAYILYLWVEKKKFATNC
jgi:hypothetical protein